MLEHFIEMYIERNIRHEEKVTNGRRGWNWGFPLYPYIYFANNSNTNHSTYIQFHTNKLTSWVGLSVNTFFVVIIILIIIIIIFVAPRVLRVRKYLL